jgi:protein-tyrosine-phosphatase
VVYLAFEYFVSYLPYALFIVGVVVALSYPALRGRLGGSASPERMQRPTPEMCRRADAIYCMTAEHRSAVLALVPDVANRTHCLADSDIPEPSAGSLVDPRGTALLIQQPVQQRLAEQLL